jgi:hypothetical protein
MVYMALDESYDRYLPLFEDSARTLRIPETWTLLISLLALGILAQRRTA